MTLYRPPSGAVVMGRPHECRKRHDTYAGLARCLWPDADVAGEGFWAVKAYCGRLRVLLVQTVDAAEQAKGLLDRNRCAGAAGKGWAARCGPARHQIVRLPHLRMNGVRT